MAPIGKPAGHGTERAPSLPTRVPGDACQVANVFPRVSTVSYVVDSRRAPVATRESQQEARLAPDDKPDLTFLAAPFSGRTGLRRPSRRLLNAASWAAAGGLLAFGVWVWVVLRRHSQLSLATVGHAAIHQTGLALTHVPKGFYLVPLVFLMVLALGLTGRLALRVLRVKPAGALESVVCSVMLGIALFIPWVLFWGTYAGLGKQAVSITFISFLAPGAGYALWHGEIRKLQELPSRWRMAAGQHSRKQLIITGLLNGVLVATLYQVLLGALVPEVGFDARWYHLGLPAHYVARGHFYNSVADNSFALSGAAFYQEILYTPFFSLFGQIGAKLINFMQLLLLCSTTFLLCRRITASVNLAISAAIILAALPMISWEGSTAENDIGTAVAATIAFYCFLRWTDGPRRGGWLWVAFACAAVAVNTKYFGLGIFAFLILASAATCKREFKRDQAQARISKMIGTGVSRPALRIYLGCLAVVFCAGAAGPIRSAAMTGDPAFPAFYHLFPTAYWNDGNASGRPLLTGHYFPRIFGDMASMPYQALIGVPRADFPWTAQWGPLFLLFTPIIVAAAFFRVNRRGDLGYLWLAVMVTLACWYPIVSPGATRYLIPLAPLFVVGLLSILHRMSQLPTTRLIAWCAAPLLGVTVLIGEPFVNTLLPGIDSPGVTQGGTYYDSDYLFGPGNIDSVQLRYLPLAQYVNAHLPKTARIWDPASAGSLLSFYLYVKPELYSGWAYDSPHAGGKWDICSQDAAYWLRSRDIGYVIVSSSLAKQFAKAPLHLVSSKIFSDSEVTLYQLGHSGPQGGPYQGKRRLCVSTG
jgi:hypothetical protein